MAFWPLHLCKPKVCYMLFRCTFGCIDMFMDWILSWENKVCLTKNTNARLECYFTFNKRVNQVLSQQSLWALSVDSAHSQCHTCSSKLLRVFLCFLFLRSLKKHIPVFWKIHTIRQISLTHLIVDLYINIKQKQQKSRCKDTMRCQSRQDLTETGQWGCFAIMPVPLSCLRNRIKYCWLPTKGAHKRTIHFCWARTFSFLPV